MLTLLPAGLLGMVVASLIATFMSTISTHLNWGSSYVVNDFYKRFLKPTASEKEQVLIGRVSTVVMMLFAALLALVLEEAREAFNLLLQIGAGTGLLFILRWFWKRINPYSEIAAMLISFVIALIFFVNDKMDDPYFELASHWQLVVGVLITTVGWIAVSLLTRPTDDQTLARFEELIFKGESKFAGFGNKIIAFLSGIVAVYSVLFATGNLIYGNQLLGAGLFALAGLATFVLFRFWNKVA
jgi:Na+/proline symporter